MKAKVPPELFAATIEKAPISFCYSCCDKEDEAGVAEEDFVFVAMKLPPAPWKTESKWKSFWLVVDDEGEPCFESCVRKLSEEGRCSLLLLLSLLKLFDAVGEGSADFRIMLPPPKASANNILISSCCCCCCCCFGE